MTDIKTAIDSINKIFYSNESYIQELKLLQKMESVYTSSITNMGPLKSYNDIFTLIDTLDVPFKQTMKDVKEKLNNITRQNNDNIVFQQVRFDSIPNKQNTSPYQIVLNQLSNENQYHFIYINLIIQLFSHLIIILFMNTQSTNNYKLQYSIEQLIREQNWLQTHFDTIIQTFILNDLSNFHEFRTKLYNALNDSNVQLFCLQNTRPTVSSNIKMFFNLLLQQSVINKQQSLYLRYIIQFIKAPYFSNIQEQTSTMSLEDALKKNDTVFVPPKMINEYRSFVSQRPAPIRVPTSFW